MIILRIVTIFSPLRIFLPISARRVRARRRLRHLDDRDAAAKIPNGAVLLIMFAVVVFLVGLVSEQISALRFEGRR